MNRLGGTIDKVLYFTPRHSLYYLDIPSYSCFGISTHIYHLVFEAILKDLPITGHVDLRKIDT